MLAVLLFIATVICAINWLRYWVSALALTKYMLDKGCLPPSDEEIRACCEYVWKKLLHIS